MRLRLRLRGKVGSLEKAEQETDLGIGTLEPVISTLIWPR